MVIGFDRFREAFRAFAENYIVIGGSACDWLFTSLNAQFRATKDIDLVVVAERMTPEFASSLWAFIRAGIRLQAQIVEGTRGELVEPLRADMAEFLAAYEKDPLDPKTIGVPGTFAEALSRIREVFGVEASRQ